MHPYSKIYDNVDKFIRAYLNELSEHIIFTFKIEITLILIAYKE